VQRRVFQGAKEIGVHLQVFRLRVEFSNRRKRGESRRCQGMEIIVQRLVHASNRDIGSITAPDSALEKPVTARKIAGTIALKVERLVQIVTKVQNDNPKTPTPIQVYLQGVALMETLKWMEK